VLLQKSEHHKDIDVTSSSLFGLKVLDLSRVLAGPLCTMMLGDLGANVIKIERPDGGDETRGWGPPFDANGESAYFLSANRNKRSLAIDFNDDADRRCLSELISSADVVVENFLPGVLARKGFDAATILAQNPRLIWCSILGYPTQPERPGYDFAVQAESGWMSVTGESAGRPVKTAVALVDVLAGKDAAIAILAALIGRRDAPASHRHLSITLAASAVAALVNVAQNALVSGADARRWGNAHANLVPYQLFDTADVPIVIAVGSDAQWRALVAILGDEALIDDDRFRTNAGRVANRNECVERLQKRLGTESADVWQERCARLGVPVGRVRTVLEALAEFGVTRTSGLPSSVGGQVLRPPPRLGEHSAEIRANGW
jgi:crotonobetainyl-CoA:carnitine CoA-transferase CaiB-like acyl-CoA transferase